MEIKTLIKVEKETMRFLEKLKAAKERLSKDEYAKYGCKENGAVKRAALDLKLELTEITK